MASYPARGVGSVHAGVQCRCPESAPRSSDHAEYFKWLLVLSQTSFEMVRIPVDKLRHAILVHRRVDISVAVAVAEGLMTPVLRDADRKSLLAISAEARDLAARAKNKKLRPEEMQNGTFSISNLGMYGIDAFAAVINPPEGAILAVGQVRREPVVRGESVVPGRRRMAADDRRRRATGPRARR